MRKNLGAKEFIYPMPVFIIATYDENGKANAMNAAWGSIGDTKQIFICLSPEHKTVKNILAKKAFTVSMGTASQVVSCDYVGLTTGNKINDKMEKAGFHTTKSEFVDAPIINELPMTVECKLINYDEKTSHLLGEIVNISVDEKVLDADGKINPEKLEPISYDPVNHTYRKLGEIVGAAFSDGKKLM